ncbi:uncharacterized protein LOC110110592 isoform X2 [Dendrobium catenatum]|uniref:Protein TILLER ANGLE CONTROL 1 n=1 Tax=Dendrobium catenatum TaxID=906689 RepID=A0A2I0VK52_9ASPA|nr:uncharacterized protein LOC110110592 isoform X2 [Dendrobium catenatum]PKU63785.1 hypothetical protein MA16_Dca010703 [Dendrobium catenatum]
MKILDWMHRKLHPATNYSRVSHTTAPAFECDIVDLIDPAHQPPSAAGTEPDTETPLLLHASLAGILTIGTLGHSHPFFLPYFSEEPKLEFPVKEIQVPAKPPAQIPSLQPGAEYLMIETEQFVVEVNVPEEKLMVEPLLKEEKERKERTTLADLLSTESANNGRKQSPAIAGVNKSAPPLKLKSGAKEEKQVKRKKKGDYFGSSKSETVAAAQRIQRMITRMVKKKIHPEAAATGRKGGGAAVVAADLLLLSRGDAA